MTRMAAANRDIYDEPPRSIFSSLWFRAFLVIVVLGVIAVVVVPYALDMLNPPGSKQVAVKPAAPPTPPRPAAPPPTPGQPSATPEAPPATSAPPPTTPLPDNPVQAPTPPPPAPAEPAPPRAATTS